MKTYLKMQFSWALRARLCSVCLIITAIFTTQFTALAATPQDDLSRRVDLTVQEVPLKKVLQELEKMSDFRFVFSSKKIQSAQKVNAQFKQEPLSKVLDALLMPRQLTYELSGKVIIVRRIEKTGAVETPSVSAPILTEKVVQKAAAFTVSGTVKDLKGEPLVGASIILEGSSKGTVTDDKGFFTFDILDSEKNGKISISFVGYEKQIIDIEGRFSIDVTLKESGVLEEFVKVGYGQQAKVNLTGAVGVADNKRLENRPIASVGEGLQGVIPNLNVNVRNGDPSADVTFNIRGYESINGGSPLVLVDGVPMDLNRINPNDVKSVSVLKDASAAAVYGARAAFGVILVETKKGSQGKVTVNLNSQMSLAKPIFNMDVITDPHEFVKARNLANVRTSGVPTYDDDYVQSTKAYSENPATAPQWKVVNGVLRFYGYNNYQDNIMTEYSPTQQHDLSVSGGSEKSKFYVSLGYFKKDGYLEARNETFNRYNVLMKADFKVNDWLSLDPKIVFNSQNSDKPHFYNWDVNINSLARVNPIQAIQFPDLEYYVAPGDRDKYAPLIGKYFGGTNFFPYLLDGGRNTFSKNDTWLSQGVTLTPLKGLTIRSDFSYNIFSRDSQDIQSKIDIVSDNLISPNPISNGFSGDDWVFNSSQSNRYYVFNAYAEYVVPNLGKNHLKTMIGFNQEEGTFKGFAAQNRGLITPFVPNLTTTTGTQQGFGNNAHVALRGAFYRLNYDFDERYLIELTGRYDGSSRFQKETRFGFFPSFSAAWRLSNEPFMSNTRKWLDNLKIRASYGTLGNQLLGNNYYPYLATMGSGQSPNIFSNALIPFVSPAGLISPSLTWETVVSKNLGLDFTMLNGKLDASVDIYSRDTRDMLMNVTYPAILGTPSPRENAADLTTKGWELALTWRDKFKKNWNYDITIALSDWTSRITKFENPTGAINSTFRVGQQLGEIWGFETVGIFQDADAIAAAPKQNNIGANWRPGDVQYADINGDGKIDFGGNTVDNPGDRKIIGNTTPRYSFGVNGSLGYKNIRLTAFFQGVGQRDYWPSNDNWNWFFPFNAGHVEKYYLTDTWSETNRNAYFPAPHVSTNDKKNVQTQSRYLQNAAYVRLKNITLSYELPEKLMSRIKLSRFQLFVSGMNLWEYSPIRKPLDPETIFSGAIEYPMQRIFTLGANASF